jgi:hypothetical protein
MNPNNVHFDMRKHRITYAQLDKLLSQLGFVRHQGTPKWVWYEHADSSTEIFLANKKPDEVARPSEVVSARVHLVAKGLISEEEIDAYLAKSSPGKKAEKHTRRGQS